MYLSAPIFRLKRTARLHARNTGIPLAAALDHIAQREGFTGWSLLAARYGATDPAPALFARLSPGDRVLLAARPGQGKTLLGLGLIVSALQAGHATAFFTLEYTQSGVVEAFDAIGHDLRNLTPRPLVVTSDDISATLIQDHLRVALPGTLAVIDYLQLLDQRRDSPDLSTQMRALADFARARGVILVFLSQIDRHFDPAQRALPDARDIRLPNPVPLSLFSKACFLHDGALRLSDLQ